VPDWLWDEVKKNASCCVFRITDTADTFVFRCDVLNRPNRVRVGRMFELFQRTSLIGALVVGFALKAAWTTLSDMGYFGARNWRSNGAYSRLATAWIRRVTLGPIGPTPLTLLSSLHDLASVYSRRRSRTFRCIRCLYCLRRTDAEALLTRADVANAPCDARYPKPKCSGTLLFRRSPHRVRQPGFASLCGLTIEYTAATQPGILAA
jgi:hypothetical protein